MCYIRFPWESLQELVKVSMEQPCSVDVEKPGYNATHCHGDKNVNTLSRDPNLLQCLHESIYMRAVKED